ncbi:RNA-directed DNA polymerase, eukaryota [Tanacetum coccineum]
MAFGSGISKESYRASFNSKEDQTRKIFKSMFVMNFPDHFTARDLWNVCLAYGNVIDVYIPLKKSKAGKKFAFVRFIKVDNLERLIRNLCTIWIGRFHLHANVVRFQREPSTHSSPPNNSRPRKTAPEGVARNSFAVVLKTGKVNPNFANETSPAIVLDDSCILGRDFSCSLMGKMKDISAIPNLYVILANEGFEKVKISYLGGLWVLLDLDSTTSKDKISNHVGVGSWFDELKPASDSFVCEERIVWISIEGLPIKAFNQNAFAKIIFAWGKLADVDDSESESLSLKILCVKTKPNVSVNDTIKVIIKGQVHWVRVKELEAWSPKFTSDNEDNSSSDDESDDGFNAPNSGNKGNGLGSGNDSEFDHVSESSFVLENDKVSRKNSTSSEKHSFTPDVVEENVVENESDKNSEPKTTKSGNNEKEPSDNGMCYNGLKFQASGSILEVIDELIKMNFLSLNIQGLGNKTKKGWIQELNTKHRVNLVAIQETKMDKMDLFSIKALWGNFSFDYAFSPSIGNSDGTWTPSSSKLLIISIYAPQELIERRMLWDYLRHLIDTWDGECVLLSDFNEVRCEKERHGTLFNIQDANAFNNFINMAGLVDLPLEGYSFTWSHKSTSKKSKLDRFLISEGLLAIFPSISALCFDKMVEESWKNSEVMESNSIIKLKKKLQVLKSSIKQWLTEDKHKLNSAKVSIQTQLIDLDKSIDQGRGDDVMVKERSNLLKELQDLNSFSSLGMAQKAKVWWAIEGDENSKYFHGFPKHLSLDQKEDLECNVSYDEIKKAVWDCGINKSLGPDGFTFEFYRRYWNVIDQDVVAAVSLFFSTSSFPIGCNSSFIALIPKTQEAKVVKDFRPISLIGIIYKIITKILANRLSLVIPDLVSEVQSAFVPNRQIIHGLFILNEILSWCKYKNSKAMIFKIDFEKAFDSVRWDYLDSILHNFGFGAKWRSWIQGCLNSAMGSILVNGSPTSEFKFFKGLKQGDPLSPFLFILIMESLHISFNNMVNAGLYKGIRIDDSLCLSHLFYADDVVFIGKWDLSNLSMIVNVLKWFFLASGLKINLHKSKLFGIGISHDIVASAARSIGCSTLSMPFNYLGVKVGGSMSRLNSWDDVLAKLTSRLSKWKLKTLSIGGRLMLTKSVLSSLPLYYMSSFKVPKGVLKKMESTRRNFFNGVENSDKKISLVSWKKVLASKKNGGLGVASFFALNRALLFKWIWRRSPWIDIVREFTGLANKGIDLLSLVKKSVATKLRDSSLIASFRRMPRGGIEEEQLKLLFANISSVMLSNVSDRWIWRLDSSGYFLVKSARGFIDDIFLPKVEVPTRWVKTIPIKVNIFAWRVCLDKLPTRLNLSLCGLDIPSILCPLCSITVESTPHLLFSCHLARQLWRKVARWWELEIHDFLLYDDWILWLNNL